MSIIYDIKHAGNDSYWLQLGNQYRSSNASKIGFNALPQTTSRWYGLWDLYTDESLFKKNISLSQNISKNTICNENIDLTFVSALTITTDKNLILHNKINSEINISFMSANSNIYINHNLLNGKIIPGSNSGIYGQYYNIDIEISHPDYTYGSIYGSYIKLQNTNGFALNSYGYFADIGTNAIFDNNYLYYGQYNSTYTAEETIGNKIILTASAKKIHTTNSEIYYKNYGPTQDVWHNYVLIQQNDTSTDDLATMRILSADIFNTYRSIREFYGSKINYSSNADTDKIYGYFIDASSINKTLTTLFHGKITASGNVLNIYGANISAEGTGISSGNIYGYNINIAKQSQNIWTFKSIVSAVSNNNVYGFHSYFANTATAQYAFGFYAQMLNNTINTYGNRIDIQGNASDTIYGNYINTPPTISSPNIYGAYIELLNTSTINMYGQLISINTQSTLPVIYGSRVQISGAYSLNNNIYGYYSNISKENEYGKQTYLYYGTSTSDKLDAGIDPSRQYGIYLELKGANRIGQTYGSSILISKPSTITYGNYISFMQSSTSTMTQNGIFIINNTSNVPNATYNAIACYDDAISKNVNLFYGYSNPGSNVSDSIYGTNVNMFGTYNNVILSYFRYNTTAIQATGKVIGSYIGLAGLSNGNDRVLLWVESNEDVKPAKAIIRSHITSSNILTQNFVESQIEGYKIITYAVKTVDNIPKTIDIELAQNSISTFDIMIVGQENTIPSTGYASYHLKALIKAGIGIIGAQRKDYWISDGTGGTIDFTNSDANVSSYLSGSVPYLRITIDGLLGYNINWAIVVRYIDMSTRVIS